MSKYTNMAAAAAVSAALSFGTAQAATTTIHVVNDGDVTNITVDCVNGTTQNCWGFIDGRIDNMPGAPDEQGVLHEGHADLYNLPDSDPGTELGALNMLISGTSASGNPYTLADGTKTDSGDIPNDALHSFSTNAAHAIFKIGQGTLAGGVFFLELAAPGTIDLIFTKGQSGPGGLSHYTEYGTSVVPLPAGLVLFLTGLAGVGFLGRYKAKRREVPTA